MSLYSWLHTVGRILNPSDSAPHRGQRHQQRSTSHRAATHRPSLEILEDRLTLSFSPAGSYTVDTNPLAVVTGDFNNDGHLDLATANPVAETVSVLFGDGAGGFGDAINSALWASGTNRVSLTVADFDNDGDDDLAAALYRWDYAGLYTAGVRVFLSNGDGTFGSPSYPFTTDDDDLAVAAGDFNNDGNLDAVGVGGEYPFSGGVAFLGNGAGRFLSHFDFGALYSEGVAIGDFTGDGVPDLVTAGETVNVFPGRGDGMFDDAISHSANGGFHTGVAVADFNGDGKLDAVTSDADVGTISELLGNGNGTLTYAGAYAVGSFPSAVVVGDFNGDGHPDVAAANGDSNTVSVLLNDGDWPPPPPPPPGLRIGDVTIVEGNTGAANAVFTVTLSTATAEMVTVAYATANGTATAGSDYQDASGTLTIPAGQTSATITVLVNGDRLAEVSETLLVNVSSPTNANIIDGQGSASILDDEPRISTTRRSTSICSGSAAMHCSPETAASALF